MYNLCRICFLLLIEHLSFSQTPSNKLSRSEFFTEERPIKITISTDIRSLRKYSEKPAYQPAAVTVLLPDSSLIHEQIRLKRRGKFRNRECYLASLMLDFKNPSSPDLSPLKRLKWVGGCDDNSSSEQYLLKEFLVYKTYNILTEMSFRVRLAMATYQDTTGKVKPYTQYAFLIEDIGDLAKRNHCVEKKSGNYHTEWTNRNQMTLVAMFQYMIGNTDWSVPYYHNIKLIVPMEDTLSKPYAIPYDFDYCGFVNPPYAVPPEELGIHSVRQRLYRGFPRTIKEIDSTAAMFTAREPQITSTINGFDLLNKNSKKDVLGFLDEFFRTIKNNKYLESEFVDKARTR